ncbi:MAG: RNA-guided pseudouridylation complex pseudouridine synthase subunit Cbf5 [Candidatus Aenigmarchaeota archaeon]|nr:RNA-guided pseudouridylation complex pseudouridine synthase subunit Cbf5 [Candidatus Aenigmarchaeota archaeon]
MIDFDNSEWLVKEEAETNTEYGTCPGKRSIEMYIKNGFVIVDKPKGPTSHQVAAWVRDMFGVNKAGHPGTLDPAVTGVLPVFIGNSVKVLPLIARSDKEYVCLMHAHKDVEAKKIRSAINEFVGTITQMPPVKSGVKRRFRDRKIHYIKILEISGRSALFLAGTEAGTYIRTLCADIGKKLGVGAHMQELRRTKAGMFLEKDAHSLHEIRDAYEFCHEDDDESSIRNMVRPLEDAITHAGQIVIKDSAVSSVCNGAPLHAGGVLRIKKDIREGDKIALLSLKGELVALGTASLDSAKMIKKAKGIVTSVDRVVLNPTNYPKTWGKQEA